MKEEADSHRFGSAVPSVFCRRCGSALVQALDWEQGDDVCWHVRLWCPECGHEQVVALERPHLLYLSMAIEDGFAWMLAALLEFEASGAGSVNMDLARRAQTDRIPPVRR